MGHKFKVGESVTVTLKGFGVSTNGRFTVVRQLPEQQGYNQYRVKSVLSGQERVVLESELN